jgi:hypothetical protein
MNRSYKTLTALLWLAPIAIAVRYWQVWDRLPMRVASHFNAAGRANGWMTRGAMLSFDVIFLAFLAGIFFAALHFVERKYALAKLWWALLAFFHAEIWTLAWLLNSTLEYNLNGSPIAILPLLIVSGLGGAVIVAFALGEKRGTKLLASDVLAEEVHSGRRLGVSFLLIVAALTAMALTIPNSTARLAFGLSAAITAAAYGMAWDGFHYYFTRHGVEIRTLGFRLKSIPALQIKNYEIQSWNPVGGFGIRGLGNRKAYVWGKTGVRVEMYDGEVYLGRGDPQRIVHDLDLVKQKVPLSS